MYSTSWWAHLIFGAYARLIILVGRHNLNQVLGVFEQSCLEAMRIEVIAWLQWRIVFANV